MLLTSKQFQKIVQKLSRRLTWPIMFMLMLLQALVTYILLAMAGEIQLTHDPIEFFYYNMVVVSTVGFGDLSPVTHIGKGIVAFWQIPSGLIVFASFIGKSTQLFIDIARKNMNGSNDFSHLNDHILLLCWDKYSTEQVVQLILGDKKRKKRRILLCVTDEMKNPFPDNDEVSFAKLRTFSDTEELDRIALQKARRIIIDGKSDDETLSIALSIATFADKSANITAHFFDETKANLLKMHCPHIECSIDNSAQMMVRSMQDPGSSKVTEQLLSTLNGATLYSFLVPELEQEIAFGELFDTLKQRYDMILLGFSKSKNGDDIRLNPASDVNIQSHYYLHYIANERMDVTDIDWKNIKQA
ncbi:two pore domain potassium channel family protein [Psychromonas sp. RZ22]|uniref:potassium channel family protein n=1 Tax=Psychromonas algarum TaxID=2555643 RepID=UPI0010685FD7|nr:potassium channel family protein [Psychromonas sp. RZ22]TEW55619.1 two pore domain potassium channel family protein [Psychromonas sp. RZ22]